MTNVIRDTVITTVVIDGLDRVLVPNDQTRVVTVGTQGPPGPAGGPGMQGPPGPASALNVPVNSNGGVLFMQASTATANAAEFHYDTTTQLLTVAHLSATLDGGNF
jgi:hypothetical protein